MLTYEEEHKDLRLSTQKGKLEAVNRRIKRLHRDLEDETDEGELRRIKKGLTKAEEEKLELQQQCNDTGIQKSVAKKRKGTELWAKANPRAIKFHKEINNRGLKKTPTITN